MSNKRKPWERQERHHCVYCNVWLGSDRQSILLHENGIKHKENVEKYMENKRKTNLEKEKAANLVQKSLQQMEAAARQAHVTDLPYYLYDGTALVPSFMPPVPPPLAVVSMAAASSSQDQQQHSLRQEKKQWQDRKKHREDDSRKHRKSALNADNDGDDKDDDDDHHPRSSSIKRIKIEPGQGHYTSAHSEKTWLEGVVFGEILEEDMPVQLWTGPLMAGAEEKRLVERDFYWKDSLVVAVRKQQQQQQQQQPDSSHLVVLDVAYLESSDATQETLVKCIPLDRIRILLGNPNDDRIPETLEEARLLAMEGEDEELHTEHDAAKASSIDEATGFSSWTTVSVKKTTVRQELKDERARLRQQRKEAALEAERQAKQAEERKMEEAKVDNADDSALGAYDVWSRGTKEGYKGVDIHGEVKVEVHELGKKLADGKVVGFKKTAFKAKNKKQNRRTTSADD